MPAQHHAEGKEIIFPRSKAKTVSRVDANPALPALGRSGVAVVAIMRNEEASISSWIQFHAVAGVRQFFLYDNGSTDRTVEIARSIPGVDVVVVPWMLEASIQRQRLSLHKQVLAYAHAIATFGGRFRWMTFIDIDEYLFPKRHETLNDALATLDGFQNVSVPWTMFDASTQDAEKRKSPVFGFAKRAMKQSGILLNFKCVVDPCDVVTVSVHKFWTRQMKANTVNGNGNIAHYKRRSSSAFLPNDVFQLNHYCPTSSDDIENKVQKGAVSGSAKTRRETLLRKRAEAISAAEIEDLSALEFLATKGIKSPNDLSFCHLK